MPFDLASVLPQLLLPAIDWAKEQSNSVLASGIALSDTRLAIARKVGVLNPEKIRVSLVPSLPLPEDPELRLAAIETGLLGPGMVGLTLGYGIFICDGHATNRLLSHECRHVFQYEKAGSIEAFLPVYLEQIATFGYQDAPFEVDARNHELEDA